MIRMMNPARVLLAALLTLSTASAASAQSSSLRGRVVDADGRPVPDVTVVLHHVTDAGGAEVGRAVSSADGVFVLELDSAPPGGVYFAATRHEGSLFMGAPFRTLREIEGTEYVIAVGVNAVGGAPTPGPPPPPGAGRGWAIGLIAGALGILFVVLPLARRRPGTDDRAVLLELAELEERFEAGDAELLADGGAAYRERRESLRARLREA